MEGEVQEGARGGKEVKERVGEGRRGRRVQGGQGGHGGRAGEGKGKVQGSRARRGGVGPSI